jgi:hypothetical protein
MHVRRDSITEEEVRTAWHRSWKGSKAKRRCRGSFHRNLKKPQEEVDVSRRSIKTSGRAKGRRKCTRTLSRVLGSRESKAEVRAVGGANGGSHGLRGGLGSGKGSTGRSLGDKTRRRRLESLSESADVDTGGGGGSTGLGSGSGSRGGSTDGLEGRRDSGGVVDDAHRVGSPASQGLVSRAGHARVGGQDREGGAVHERVTAVA